MVENKKIRVLIADDFDIMRQVIHKLIEDTEDMEVVDDAPTLQDALKRAQVLQPDVILMNDYLPPTNSAHATKLFREVGVTAAILVISMHVEPELIRHSFESGANGFMHKDEMGELLTAAIRQVYHNERYLSPRVEQALTHPEDEL